MDRPHACASERFAEQTGREEADSPIDFGGKLSTATHTLATVAECSERADGCTGRERRGVDEVVRAARRVTDEALGQEHHVTGDSGSKASKARQSRTQLERPGRLRL